MITYNDVITAIREYVLDDVSSNARMAHTDEELKHWIKQAAHEVLHLKRWLCVDADGNPRKGTEIIGETGVDIPEKYDGALLHGALMFAFTEDQQRSSFERGLFNAQLGIMGR